MNSTEQSLISIKTLGAKGDGATDDTTAIQRALDLAAETCGTVEVPPGVYSTGRLRMHKHTGMVGYPTYAWRGIQGSVLRLADPAADCLIDASLSEGVRLDGVCLDGASMGSDIHGVLLNNADGNSTEDSTLIERCKIANFTGDGVRMVQVWCFRIRGNMISNNGGHGLAVQGCDGFILDNWLSMNAGAGYATLMDRGNSAITITGNRIEWNRSGGIVIRNGSHYNITGNYIDRCSPGLVFIRTPEHPQAQPGVSAITGNIFYRSGLRIGVPEDSLEDSQVLLRGLRGVTFTGNTVVGGGNDANPHSSGHGPTRNWGPSYGLVLENLHNSVVTSNVLDRAATKSLVQDLGNHGEGFVLKDNPGELFRPS